MSRARVFCSNDIMRKSESVAAPYPATHSLMHGARIKEREKLRYPRMGRKYGKVRGFKAA